MGTNIITVVYLFSQLCVFLILYPNIDVFIYLFGIIQFLPRGERLREGADQPRLLTTSLRLGEPQGAQTVRF